MSRDLSSYAALKCSNRNYYNLSNWQGLQCVTLQFLICGITNLFSREKKYEKCYLFSSGKLNQVHPPVLCTCKTLLFSNENTDFCSSFNKKFLDVLNKHTLLKKKRVTANHASYVSKSMRKVAMRRSQLENLYFKKRIDESAEAFKKQKNYCSRLYKKERKKIL